MKQNKLSLKYTSKGSSNMITAYSKIAVDF